MSKVSFLLTKPAILLASVVLMLASCTKEERHTGMPIALQGKAANLSDEQRRRVEDVSSRIPMLRFYDEQHNRFIDVNPNTREFSFATPNDGWNFSNSDVAWEAAEGGGGILFIPFTSFGENAGSGNVIAGGSALDIDYAFCFSASDEALGLDLFDFVGDLTGVSVVLGISGNFEALMNDEIGEDADFTDFFHGFAMYVVYADTAQGSYEVLNWLDDLESEPDDLADQAFSFVIDFVNPGLYLSSDGNMNVEGGSMYFDGEYLAITDFVFEFEDDYEPEFSYVSGYGEMGCD